MCKNTSSFLAVSFVVLMSNMTLSFFHQTMNFFQLIICLWLCLICGLTTCSSSGLDSGLNIPFPTEIYRQQEIILFQTAYKLAAKFLVAWLWLLLWICFCTLTFCLLILHVLQNISLKVRLVDYRSPLHYILSFVLDPGSYRVARNFWGF